MTNPDAIADILRETIDSGQAVEIEGLGTFRRSADGAYHFAAQKQPEVFLAYVMEDLAPARRLCESLRAGGCSPWLDKNKLLPGQNWLRSIEHAIENSDVFVACFSSSSISKRGQFQAELRHALHCARRLPFDAVFLIPVRFEPCTIPRSISDSVQYVDLFPDWERGIARVMRAIRNATPLRSRFRLE